MINRFQSARRPFKIWSRILLATGAFISALIFTSPVKAQEKPWTLSGDIGAVSDYSFRGLSRSHGDPAVHGTLDLAHSGGLFMGGFCTVNKLTFSIVQYMLVDCLLQFRSTS